MVYQSSSSSPVPHVVAGVDALQRRIGEALTTRLTTLGIALRGSHGRILSLIGPEGTRPSVLAEGWVSKQAIGQRVRELQELELVTVQQDPLDRRARVVRRTSEGDRILNQLTEGIADFERELRDEVGAARYELFREVLDDLVSDHLPPALRPGKHPPDEPEAHRGGHSGSDAIPTAVLSARSSARADDITGRHEHGLGERC